MRAARTPPEPPPITNRSTSKSAIGLPGRGRGRSDLLAALFHLGAELLVARLGKNHPPLLPIGHAELDCPGLGREQLLAERRLVERGQILQLLLGKLVGIDLGHALADLLLSAGKVFRDDYRDF